MNKEYIIGTFNLKNDLWNKEWKYREYAKKLADYITVNRVDFLACQELTKKYSCELKNNLLDSYNIYGNYRFKNFRLLSRYDESVGILTKYKPNKVITKYLSIFPGIPRIMSVYEDDNIIIINVHLDYKSMLAKRIEFRKILKFVSKNNNKNIVLLGDFNVHEDNSYFEIFRDKLKTFNISMVDSNNRAFSKNTIDYVFLSDNIELIDIYSDKELMSISDHRPVFFKIKIKK